MKHLNQIVDRVVYRPDGGRGAGAEPSLKQSSVLGLALVPLTIAAALGALALVDASAF